MKRVSLPITPRTLSVSGMMVSKMAFAFLLVAAAGAGLGVGYVTARHGAQAEAPDGRSAVNELTVLREDKAALESRLTAALFERDFIAAGSAEQSGGIATYYDVAASCADSGSVAAR